MYGKGPYSKRGNLPASISWKTLSDMQQRIFYESCKTLQYVPKSLLKPVVQHWLERDIAKSHDPSYNEQTFCYVLLLIYIGKYVIKTYITPATDFQTRKAMK